MSRSVNTFSLASVLAAVLLLLFGSGCGPEASAPSCVDCRTVSSAMLPCDPESGCPGDEEEEPTPPSPAALSVIVTNGSVWSRTYNAGLTVFAPDGTIVSRNWFIPVELLAPGEVRTFAPAASAYVGYRIRVNVTAYDLKTEGSWAQSEHDVFLTGPAMHCSYRYEDGAPSRVIHTCN